MPAATPVVLPGRVCARTRRRPKPVGMFAAGAPCGSGAPGGSELLANPPVSTDQRQPGFFGARGAVAHCPSIAAATGWAACRGINRPCGGRFRRHLRGPPGKRRTIRASPCRCKAMQPRVRRQSPGRCLQPFPKPTPSKGCAPVRSRRNRPNLRRPPGPRNGPVPLPCGSGRGVGEPTRASGPRVWNLSRPRVPVRRRCSCPAPRNWRQSTRPARKCEAPCRRAVSTRRRRRVPRRCRCTQARRNAAVISA